MESAADLLTSNVDKSQIPPLHQKRILAFVNHFLISSCSFLNDFSLQCETKFIELERKLQKIEASLTILEAKLDSIPNVATNVENKESTPAPETTPQPQPAIATEKNNEASKTETAAETVEIVKETNVTKGIPASEHSLYKKFFKMLQVGVPLQAVKLKMQSEGIDSKFIDDPKAILLETEADS